MKNLKVFTSLVVVCLLGATAAVSGASTAAQKQGGARVNGRAVYESKCARCHGSDGAGHTRMAEIVEPPDMTDSAWQRQRSNARMIASVNDGRGQMPAFKKKLTRQEIAAVVAHVRTLKRK